MVSITYLEKFSVFSEKFFHDMVFLVICQCSSTIKYFSLHFFYHFDYKDIEIMLDYENDKVITLGELTPEWWI